MRKLVDVGYILYQNAANICHLMPATDLYKKQLHSFIINDKITSSGKSSTGVGKNIAPQSNFRQLPEMGLTVLLHWGRVSGWL